MLLVESVLARFKSGPNCLLRPQAARLFAGCLLLTAMLAAACKKGAGDAPVPGSAEARLSPLVGQDWLVEVPVEGFGKANISVPIGAVVPRPVLVALHGDADRPEWQCGSYRHASHGWPFVLCPRGQPRHDARFRLGPVEETSRELRAALPALKSRFAAHVAKGPVVLAALGPAVEHAIQIAREEPSFFAYLVLVDGSLQRLSLPIVTRYAQAGGKRALFVCTRLGCDPEVEGRVLALRSAGVDARLVQVERGTGLDSETVAEIRKHWSWLIAGDSRWR